MLAGHVLVQSGQDGIQFLIGCRAAASLRNVVVHFRIVRILHYLELIGLHYELIGLSRQFQYSVVLQVALQVSAHHGLTHQCVVHVGEGPEFLQLVMAVALYFVRGAPYQHVHHVFRLEMLFHGRHGLQHGQQTFGRLNLLLRVAAVVALAAVFLVLQQQLVAYLLLLHRLALHQLVQFLQVLAAIERDAVAHAAVASGTSRLLVISLQALRHVVVYHEAYVGLVYAHAERYGGHYHVHFLAEKRILVLSALVGVHAGMIRQRGDAVDVQHLGEFLHLLAAQAVHYSRFARMLPDVFNYVLVYVLGLGAHLVIQVLAVEA